MNSTSPTITSPALTWTTSDRSAVRSQSDDVRALPGALRSEWIKLTALRANKVILTLTALTGGLIAGVLAVTNTDPTLTAAELFIYPLPLVAMLAAVVGILMFTGEAQHGTLAVALATRPARWVIVSAKTITATVVGLTLGAAGMTAGFAGAALGGVTLGSGTSLISRALWALLYIALAALMGLGVGMIAGPPRIGAPLPALQRRLPAPRRRAKLRAPGRHRRPTRASAVRPHLRRLRPDQPRRRHRVALPARHELIQMSLHHHELRHGSAS
jgi:uncharacterized integral membrane protein